MTTPQASHARSPLPERLRGAWRRLRRPAAATPDPSAGGVPPLDLPLLPPPPPASPHLAAPLEPRTLTLVAQPFSSFVGLTRFLESVCDLDGVQRLEAGPAEAGRVQATLVYAGPEPLQGRLSRLLGPHARVAERGGTISVLLSQRYAS